MNLFSPWCYMDWNDYDDADDDDDDRKKVKRFPL